MCVCLCSSGKEWSSGEAAAHPIHPHSRAHHLLARGVSCTGKAALLVFSPSVLNSNEVTAL